MTVHMAIDVSKLLVECQLALGISQKEMGALLGKNRRTIQRWQERGRILLPQDAEKLADAVRPVRPDLADQAVAAGVEGAKAVGLSSPPTAEVIDAILMAAAAVSDTSVEAIRPVVAAAFAKADEMGVDVQALLVALDDGE
jgi:hypothetical protein